MFDKKNLWQNKNQLLPTDPISEYEVTGNTNMLLFGLT
jgi:hypothetical protein